MIDYNAEERRLDADHRVLMEEIIETLEICGFSREEIEKDLEKARKEFQAKQANNR